MKIKLAFLFVITLHNLQLLAQSPDFAWANHLGPLSAAPLAVDNDGNSYIAASYNSTVVLGSVTIPYIGPGSNQYIAKFDPNGVALWGKRLTGIAVIDNINPDKLVVDNSGNVYLSSVYYTGATIDGVAIPGTPANGRSYFISRFNSSGTPEWIKTVDLSDNIYNKTYNSIQLDPEGNICMTGLFNTAISFDANHSLTNTGNQNGVDAFATTYDPDGNVVKCLHLGVVNPLFSGTYPDELFKLDHLGSIYRLVPETQTLIKYDDLGNVLSTKTITCSGAISSLTCMVPDREGNVFIGGWFYNGNLTIENNLLTKYGNSNNADAILFKLDATGTLQWIDHYQYTISDSYVQVRVDELGNVYAMGQHGDPSETRSLLTKFSNDGTQLWEQVIIPGAAPPGDPAGVVAAQNIVQAHNGGNILVVGYFKERIYFDASTSFTGATGVANIFLAQYGICNTPQPSLDPASLNITICSGDSIQLSSSPASNYLWSTNETTSSIYVSQAGNYYVNAIEGSECYGTSNVLSIAVADFPNTAVASTDETLTAEETGAIYQWLDCNNGSAIIPGETNQTFIPGENGEFAVSITNAAGCVDTSECFVINNLGIGNSYSDIITLFPNPAMTYIHISGDFDLSDITIVNLVGEAIKNSSHTNDVDISELPSGTYFILVNTDKGLWSGRFTKL